MRKIMLLGMCFIAIVMVSGCTGEGATGNVVKEIEMSVEQIKDNSNVITYDDLFRNNEEHVGKNVYFRGGITQVVDDNEFRLSTKESYGWYIGDIIYIYDYNGQRILEEDIVDMWGEVTGTVSYEAVLGNTVTIPKIKVLYMEVIAEEAIESKPVTTLSDIWASSKNWDADAEIDGIEFGLKPRDADDSITKVAGTVNANLYERKCNYALDPPCWKSNLIGTWSVPIKTDDYTDYLGANVKLEYNEIGFTVNPADSMEMGHLEITFITEDGKEFNVIDDSVFLQ